MFERLRKAYREATDFDNWTVEDWKEDRWIMRVVAAFGLGVFSGVLAVNNYSSWFLIPGVVVIWLAMEYHYKRAIKELAKNE
jgi:hypothetical protein